MGASRRARGAAPGERRWGGGARTGGSDGGLRVGAGGPPERAERRSGESGDGRSSRDAEHHNTGRARAGGPDASIEGRREVEPEGEKWSACVPSWSAARGDVAPNASSLPLRCPVGSPSLCTPAVREKRAHNERDLYLRILENPAESGLKLTARADQNYPAPQSDRPTVGKRNVFRAMIAANRRASAPLAQRAETRRSYRPARCVTPATSPSAVDRVARAARASPRRSSRGHGLRSRWRWP